MILLPCVHCTFLYYHLRGDKCPSLVCCCPRCTDITPLFFFLLAGQLGLVVLGCFYFIYLFCLGLPRHTPVDADSLCDDSRDQPVGPHTFLLLLEARFQSPPRASFYATEIHLFFFFGSWRISSERVREGSFSFGPIHPYYYHSGRALSE